MIVFFMATIKSVLLGTARKSVGDINFYKTKGVQVVRSKPSIAPSYQPTEAQALQRYKMGFAQYVLNKADWKSFAWLLNLSNVRKRNAANPANRMVSNILHSDTSFITDTTIDYQTALIQYGRELMKTASSGGATLPIYFAEAGEENIEGYGINNIRVGDYSGSLYTFIYGGNKSTPYTYENLYVMGFGKAYLHGSQEDVWQPITIYPSKCIKYNYEPDTTFKPPRPFWEYYFPLNGGIVTSTGVTGFIDLNLYGLSEMVLYFSLLSSPNNGDIATSGTPINYSNYYSNYG